MAKKTTKKKSEKREKLQDNKLYRSKEDQYIGGVCGGIAEHFDIDPVWVRLIALLLLFMNGVGFIAYIILWILVPENPYQNSHNKKATQNKKVIETQEIKKVTKNQEKSEKSSYIIGIILIVIGTLFLLKNFFNLFNPSLFWP
ncbi:MAG: PspC domain-containing protein, partial [Nanoarchaeota archaeon]